MNKEEEAEFKRRFEMLWRGMYGDEENEVPGVVDWIQIFKKDKDKVKKAIYVGIGVVSTLQVLFWLIDKLHIKIF